MRPPDSPAQGADKRLPAAACPMCQTVMTAAETTQSLVDDRQDGITAGPGDLTICCRCGSELAYTDAMALRFATPDEARIIHSDPATATVLALIAKRNRTDPWWQRE